MRSKLWSLQHLIQSAYFLFFIWFWLVVVSFTTVLLWLFRVKQIKKLVSSRKGKKISVLYLEVFSPQGAGNRFRTSKWVEILNKEGFTARSKYVFEYNEYLHLTSTEGGMTFFFMVFLWERYWQCLASIFYDEVIVRREILMFNDYGNLFFERFLSTIHNHLILDFDDDIAAAKREPRTITLFGKLLLESSTKFTSSLKYYTSFIPASAYLKQKFLGGKREEDILVLPTCVDYDKFTPKSYAQQTWELTIGWVGARNNLENILVVIPALNALADKYKFKLVVVCDAQLHGTARFPVENIYWSEKEEIVNLQNIDIGIMPLIVNEENKGKAGFKLVQYMGCGLVSMSTALTVNNEIVEDGVNGFLVPPDADWAPYFEKVFNLREQYATIGKSAFEKVKAEYSFNANTEKLTTFLSNKIKPNL